MISIRSRFTAPASVPQSRRLPFLFALAFALLLPATSQAAVSLAGVHDYSGDTTLVDPNAPAGERGWAVELVPTVADCRGTLSGVRGSAQAARNAGMQVIFRVDYKQANGRQVAVPISSVDYPQWRSDFLQCISKLSDLGNRFIVGNEPNIDYEFAPISAGQYAAAFNDLWASKPAGAQLLVTFNSPFTLTNWLTDVSNQINGTDGWAIHTGGIRGSCTDPRVACRTEVPSWPFDNAFRYYRDIIAAIARFRTAPVYITEFNTFTGSPGTEPQNNYIDGWANKAFEEIRNYNATRGSNAPEVRALCWFTDKVRNGFPAWSLRNIPVALQDMKDEFRNPANRGGTTGGGCANTALALRSDRWTMQIWNNPSLSGATVEQRYDAVTARGFSFDWGSGRPSTCTGNDGYSIRFRRLVNFPSTGTYTFTARADDGVRLWVDGVRILNEWRDQGPTTFTVQRNVAAGNREVRVDYYENGGGATVSLDWVFNGGGGGGNNATVNVGGSSVPGTLAPNEVRAVSVRVNNTGGTTWRQGTLHRLGATSVNNVRWSGWSSCGGYANSDTDARIFLCNDVPPGGSYTFTFSIRAPASGTGRLGVQMVQDGVQWFGSMQTWNISISGGGGSNPYPGCPCNRTDNYCQHAPSTPGCPMTSRFGYCDPNGNGGYEDGDWVRGFNEYAQFCR